MDLDNKFRGAMLGGAIGELAFGLDDRAALTAAVDRCPSLVYTDDTTMTIGVAEVLVAHGGLDPETLGRRFHNNYRREPWRDYGPGPPALFALVESEGLSYAATAWRLYGSDGAVTLTW
jgi:poly(ADP-ribose) glycohydrolase ARH3